MLRLLNKEYYSNIHQRVEEARTTLLQIQQAKLSSFTIELARKEKIQVQTLADLVAAEEPILRQKSKIK